MRPGQLNAAADCHDQGQSRDGAGSIGSTPRCFDARLAAGPTRKVSTARVIDALHVSHAPQTIRAYREEMAAGALFPPISVYPVGRWYLLTDGHRRFQASKALTRTPIAVEVWDTGKLLADQWRQFKRRSSLWARLIRAGPTDPRARAEARALLRSTLRHWQRIAVSLASLRPARRSARPD